MSGERKWQTVRAAHVAIGDELHVEGRPGVTMTVTNHVREIDARDRRRVRIFTDLNRSGFTLAPSTKIDVLR